MVEWFFQAVCRQIQDTKRILRLKLKYGTTSVVTPELKPVWVNGKLIITVSHLSKGSTVLWLWYGHDLLSLRSLHEPHSAHFITFTELISTLHGREASTQQQMTVSGINCTSSSIISPVINGSLFLLRKSFSKARTGAWCQNVRLCSLCQNGSGFQTETRKHNHNCWSRPAMV